MTDAFPANEFWDFSIALYSKPGVAPACLVLQERHGLDVNALLFCVWLGASGRGPVDQPRLDAAFAAVADWHAQVVRTLRPLRQRLKFAFAPVEDALAKRLRAAIQKVELDAEHIEQLTLARTPAASAQPRADLDVETRAAHAIWHLGAYFARLGTRPAADDLDALGAILAPVFATSAATLRSRLGHAFAGASGRSG